MNSEDELRSYLRRVTSALQDAKRRLADIERDAREPIAIIGMACRFPGGVTSPDDLWKLVSHKVDAVGPFPTRPGWEDLYDPDPDVPGRSMSPRGGFLYDADEFDAKLFEISPKDASRLDPQQRILLEVSWEALERARIPPSKLMGSPTGVYVGIMYSDYIAQSLRQRERLDGNIVTGSLASAASGRISYTFGFHGPAVSVDTACSSSLVAIHEASSALRRGECSLALAGGVAVMATPMSFIDFSRVRALAPDGRCKPFSDQADGTTWSEGCAIVVLERLSDATRLGHPVLALLRGSAVNQDGRSQGLTAPHGPSQEKVIAAALMQAGITASDVDVVEGHGTGTPLGDPIEAGALLATYGRAHDPSRPLYLGSLKSNIGHAQAAAGVAGLIKMVMAFQHETMPPSLFAEKPTSRVDWDLGAIRLLSDSVAWPCSGNRIRRAGISSFGISGTNAHVILEEAPQVHELAQRRNVALTATNAGAPRVASRNLSATLRPNEKRSEVVVGSEVYASQRMNANGDGEVPNTDGESDIAGIPLVFYGQSVAALRANIGRIATHLTKGGESLLHLGYSLATTRSALEARASFAVKTTTTLPVIVSTLESFARGELNTGIRSSAKVVASSGVCVLFTGQGSQRAGMGSALFASDSGFRKHFEEITAAFNGYLSLSLDAALFGTDQTLLDQTMYAQPALFALELALYRRFEELGLRASTLVGHSIGELTALCAAGAIGLDDAARLVTARGRLMQACRSDGAMLSIHATEALVREALREGTEIAGVNGPSQTVVSGDASAVAAVGESFTAMGVKVQRLRVSHAFHSHHMEGALSEFEAICSTCTFSPPRVAIISNVTGRHLTFAELSSPTYWSRQLRSTVRFADCITTAHADGTRVYLECGPHGVLCGLAAACVPEGAESVFLPALRKDGDEGLAFVSALGALHTHGVDVSWDTYFSGTGAYAVDLPTYAFQRERYWLDSLEQSGHTADVGRQQAASADAARSTSQVDPLLGTRVAAPLKEALFTTHYDLESLPWLADHRVHELPMLPATGLLEVARRGAAVVLSTVDIVLSGVQLIRPLALVNREDALQVHLVLRPSEGGLIFEILSNSPSTPEDYVLHARGAVRADATPARREDLGPLRRRCRSGLSGASHYDGCSRRGVDYQNSFRSVRSVSSNPQEAVAEVDVMQPELGSGHHPAILDCCLQSAFSLLPEPHAYVPVAIESMRATASVIHGPLVCHATLLKEDGENDTRSFDFDVFNNDGQLVAALHGVRMQRVTRERLRKLVGLPDEKRMFGVIWKQLTRPTRSRADNDLWIIVAGHDPICGPLADAMRAAGASVEVLRSAGTGLLPTERACDLSNLSEVTQTMTAFWQGKRKPRGIIFASGMDERIDVGLDATASVESGCRGLLHLSQVLAQVDDKPPPVWVLTRQAMSVHVGERVRPDQSALWGLSRAIANELPELRCARFDIDDATPAEHLCAQVLAGGEEDEIALRGSEQYGSRVEAIDASSQGERPLFSNDSTYLVTGGLGGLGLALARWMVGHGARHLVLVGRSKPTPSATETIAELGRQGADVTVVHEDISSRVAVERLLTRIEDGKVPLRGVFHCAGLIDDASLPQMNWERFSRVVAPKANGAMWLHQLTQTLSLDYFVLFSSVSAIVGTPGQSNYAAANAFLDGLANARRGLGLAALSVNWGAWSDAGLAAAPDTIKRLSEKGFLSFNSEEGLEMLSEALRSGAPQVIASRFDFGRLERGLGRMPQRFADLGPRVKQVPKQAGELPPLVRRCAALPADERLVAVLDWVQTAIAEVMRGPAPTENNLPLMDSGLDSLSVVDLRNRLQEGIGQRLPATLVFDYPTAAAIANFLLTRISTALTAIADLPAEAGQSVQEKPTSKPHVENAVGVSAGEQSVRFEKRIDETGDIAIIGMACRFPGAPNLDAYWDFLSQGSDGTREVPADRFDMTPHYDPTPGKVGKSYTRRGGFLDDVYSFDGNFFGLKPPEAREMDPQNRILLEVVWEALERAGVDPDGLARSLTGVWVGCMTNDYAVMRSSCYTTYSVGSGRISYLLDLRGPSETVDTWCSSSLVAVHRAVQSLRRGESDLAITGGVNAILLPTGMVEMSQMHALSPDGTCKTFDMRADGYARGEGCGALILKRRQDAERDGDNIIAIIKGTATNSDGRGASFVTPNGVSQQQVIRAALKDARLDSSAINFFESHGSGTKLGDPIEVGALESVLAEEVQRVPIGAVKSNFGHLEGAAGMAGLIKAALSVNKREVVPNVHLRQTNPHLPLAGSHISLPVERRPLRSAGAIVTAGVSSFGLSGTNAHVILQSPPERRRGAVWSADLHLFTLSARSEGTLRQFAHRMATYLREHPSLSLGDVCFTVNVRRRRFGHRLAVLAGSMKELIGALDELAKGESPATAWSSAVPPVSGRVAEQGASGTHAELREAALRFVQGEDIDLSRLSVDVCRAVPLPSYPFERVRYALVDEKPATPQLSRAADLLRDGGVDKVAAALQRLKQMKEPETR